MKNSSRLESKLDDCITGQPSRNPKDLTADFTDYTDKKREEIHRTETS